MKYLVVLLLPLIFAFQGAQKDIIKETYRVVGVCGSCEKRIENAALIKGVLEAEWDKHKQELSVVYKSSKSSKALILKAVAEAGHDNELYTASDKAYKVLPGCCKYRENSKIH